MRELSKRRKNPYHAFADKELASKAGKAGAKARWDKVNAEKEKITEPTETSQEG